MEFLSQINGEVDFIVLEAPGQGRTLPPPLGTVDGLFWRMSLVADGRVARITELAADHGEVWIGFSSVRSGQLAVQLGFTHALPARSRRRDPSSHRKVEIRRG